MRQPSDVRMGDVGVNDKLHGEESRHRLLVFHGGGDTPGVSDSARGLGKASWDAGHARDGSVR